VFYVHTDQLNTPRKVTDTANVLRWSWDPTPFGEGTPVQNPGGQPNFLYNLRFPGQYFDLESNLNYNYFRDYDPAIGRYVESDPIGLAGGSLTTYAYVSGNPLLRIDPFGLEDCNSLCIETCLLAYKKEVEWQSKEYLEALVDCRLSLNKRGGTPGKNPAMCRFGEAAAYEFGLRQAVKTRDKCLARCKPDCDEKAQPSCKRPLDPIGKPGAGGVR
jgi:RHS repeat-associated protein